ncbi:unnamed protein product [Peniophora sp. CBMAI 1063]|nr:unnamed protein product [Peniophora sp. CBMAI 1063]
MSTDGQLPQKQRRSDWNVQKSIKTADCQEWLGEKWATYKSWAEDAETKFGLSEHRFNASIISETFTSSKARGLTKWNATLANGYSRAKDDFAAGRIKDNPGKYHEWLPKAMGDMQAKYAGLSEEQRKAEVTEYTTRRNLNVGEERRQRKPGSGFSRSVGATGDRITKLLDDLNETAGVESIIIMAPGDPHLPFTPMHHVTGTAKRFMKDVELVRKEPAVVAKMLEGYCASGIAAGPDLNVSITNTTAKAKRSKIRASIQDGLDEIVGRKVPMNYRNLEGAIVEELGVALVGWPLTDKPVSQPSGLSASELVRVEKALDDNTLCWVRLSEQQLAERKLRNKMLQDAGNSVYFPRKARAKKRRIDQVEA